MDRQLADDKRDEGEPTALHFDAAAAQAAKAHGLDAVEDRHTTDTIRELRAAARAQHWTRVRPRSTTCAASRSRGSCACPPKAWGCVFRGRLAEGGRARVSAREQLRPYLAGVGVQPTVNMSQCTLFDAAPAWVVPRSSGLLRDFDLMADQRA
jgi:hypothetical protein